MPGQEPEDLVAARARGRCRTRSGPREMWSSIATRSATLAGWFTCGSGLKIARADVDALGRVGEVAGDDVVGRQVRVLVEEVVLGSQHVLEAGLVGGLDELELVHDHRVLGVGSASRRNRHVVLDEDPEFQRTASRERRRQLRRPR